MSGWHFSSKYWESCGVTGRSDCEPSPENVSVQPSDLIFALIPSINRRYFEQFITLFFSNTA